MNTLLGDALVQVESSLRQLESIGDELDAMAASKKELIETLSVQREDNLADAARAKRISKRVNKLLK